MRSMPMASATRFTFLVDTPSAALARLVGLGAHGLVDDRLVHHPYELGHIRHAVVESRHQDAVTRNLVYLVHMRLLPFRES